MLAPNPSIPDAELMAELRDLFGEYPFLAYRSADTARRALRTLRGIKAGAFAVECAIDALRVEGEALA